MYGIQMYTFDSAIQKPDYFLMQKHRKSVKKISRFTWIEDFASKFPDEANQLTFLQTDPNDG